MHLRRQEIHPPMNVAPLQQPERGQRSSAGPMRARVGKQNGVPVGKQHLRIAGHPDAVVTQTMQNHCRISVRTRQPQQPSSKNDLIGGGNSNIPQIAMNRAQHRLEHSDVLGSQSTSSRMQTRVRQIDSTNSAKHEIKRNDDDQKTESPPATHAPTSYE